MNKPFRPDLKDAEAYILASPASQELKRHLIAWLAGTPEHDKETGDCCPDFSCCFPQLLAPLHERMNFIMRPELREYMLNTFVARAMIHEGKNVHVRKPEVLI